MPSLSNNIENRSNLNARVVDNYQSGPIKIQRGEDF